MAAPPPPPPPIAATQSKKKKTWAVVDVGSSSQAAFRWEEWKDLRSVDVTSPVEWQSVSRHVHLPGGLGSKSGVLLFQVGARVAVLKSFDAGSGDPVRERLAAELLGKLGVRTPRCRLLAREELENAREELGRRLSFVPTVRYPQFLALPYHRQMAAAHGVAESSEYSKYIEASAKEPLAEVVLLMEFIAGQTALSTSGAEVLTVEMLRAWGTIAVGDVLLNNIDRFPVLFDHNGNLANVMVTPALECVAIDQTCNPLTGDALAGFLGKLCRDPPLAGLQRAVSIAFGGVTLDPPLQEAFRSGWRKGMATIAEATSGSLERWLDEADAPTECAVFVRRVAASMGELLCA